jgi:hypothetical protein
MRRFLWQVLMRWCLRGFDVVFAEDVPNVPSQDLTTRKPPCIVDRACDSSLKRVLSLADWAKLCPAYNSFIG